MLTKVEELQLLAQCALGDSREAFGLLVEAYQQRLRQFLLNLTVGDEALADDIAQETFLKAYLNVRSFRGLSSFGTWLYRIAYNEFLGWRRRNGNIDTADTLPQNGSTEQTDALEARLDVKAALAALNDDERTVVTLFYINDMPLRKIEKITGLKNSTIRSHLHRARAKMASMVATDGNALTNNSTT